jgi:hypothetical protein
MATLISRAAGAVHLPFDAADSMISSDGVETVPTGKPA